MPIRVTATNALLNAFVMLYVSCLVQHCDKDDSLRILL